LRGENVLGVGEVLHPFTTWLSRVNANQSIYICLFCVE
jgi:hypothetical protein